MTNQLPRWYILTLTILVVVAVAYFFSNILAYILLAAALSFVGRPLMIFFTSLHIKDTYLPRWLSAVLTILTMMVVSVGIGAIFVPLLASQTQMFIEMDWQGVVEQLQPMIADLEEFLFANNLLETNGKTLTDYIIVQLKDLASFPVISDMLNNAMSITTNLMIGYFSVLFILFFFLKDRDLFFNIITTITPDNQESKLVESFDSIKVLLTRYFLGIMLQISIIFSIVSIGLWFVGVKNFLLIAFLAAIFNIIPYVGPLIGFIIAITLGLTVSLEMGINTTLAYLAFKIWLVFAIAQLIDNFISQPFIFSNSVKAHPLEIFLLILAAGSVGGVVAMILAIPFYTVLRVIGKEFFGESKIVQKLTRNL